ncbi:MAG: hypothetical protein ACI9N1_002000 [Flavobacteriales bacterium]|jgi:hypothetical protein
MEISLAEIIIAVLVLGVFSLGIWGGIRLFKWSQNDRAKIAKRNADRKAHANDQS